MKIDFTKLFYKQEGNFHWEYEPESLVFQNTTDVILQGVFGFCGCGSSGENVHRIYSALCLIYKNRASEVDELLLYVFDREGLTEHGSSVRGSWITPYGSIVIDFIESHGNELL